MLRKVLSLGAVVVTLLAILSANTASMITFYQPKCPKSLNK